MSFLSDLSWRYATKKYDTSKKVSREKLDQILEAIRMAPSSNGFQPYDVLVITNPEIRTKLQTASGNPQVTEASHLLVFAAWDHFTPVRINHFFDVMAETRGANASIEERRKSTLEAYAGSKSDILEFATKQAFIGLGFALAAAAELQIDSSPMGGFKPAEFDDILGLRAKGLRSVVILGLGHRAKEGDWLVNLKKVRRPKSEMFIEVK